LQRGSPITVVSTNPDIKFTDTKIILYDKDNLPQYPTLKDIDSWSLDVPPGLYKLEVRAKYSPANVDTVSFIDTIRIMDGRTVDVKELIDKRLSNIENLLD
jgi:hypothetical protein